MQLPRRFVGILLFDFLDMKRMHLEREKFISYFFFPVNNLTVIFGKIIKEI